MNITKSSLWSARKNEHENVRSQREYLIYVCFLDGDSKKGEEIMCWHLSK